MERNEELTKNLVNLIDETLEELEELKKSKFSAAEIKIEGPGDKELAGKPANGELDAKKAEDKEDKEDEEEEKDVEKGVLDEAEKSEDEEDKEDEEEEKKVKKGVLDEAEKSEDEEEDEEEEEAKKSETEQDDLQKSEELEAKEDELKKSLEEQETLIKSYVDSKFESLEKTIASLTKMMDEMADKPVERKGVPAGIQALEKSTEDEEAITPLSKSEVADKLFELKKSGTAVNTSDIIRVETGSGTDVQAIAEKYNL